MAQMFAFTGGGTLPTFPLLIVSLGGKLQTAAKLNPPSPSLWCGSEPTRAAQSSSSWSALATFSTAGLGNVGVGLIAKADGSGTVRE